VADAAPQSAPTAAKKISAGASTGGTEPISEVAEADTAAAPASNPVPPVSKSPAGLDTHAPQPDFDVKDLGAENRAIVVGDVILRFASQSRRGRDTEDHTKPNQDRFGVSTFTRADGLGSVASAGAETAGDGHAHGHRRRAHSAFFGVYDGHGPHGHHCSRFVQERLPHLLHRDISEGTSSIQHSIHESHTTCNDELRASEIVDTYSGTTSISLLVHPDEHDDEATSITISNVGDSRAILGTALPGSDTLRAVPLSKDQTPRRPDEAARCIKHGARILSFGQIDPNYCPADDPDAEAEDPPRVWAKHGHFPGCAFSRSIGDSVAQKLGVHSEPEMLTLKISPSVKVIVLATDGVFDVLENQEVIDICHVYRNDPAQACRAIVRKSHEEWLLNEECEGEEHKANYDDMTVLVVYVGDEDATASAPSDVSEQQPKHQHPRKRVRQKTLRHLDEMVEET